LELTKIQDEKIKFENDQSSIEPKLEEIFSSENSQSSQILPVESKPPDTLSIKDTLNPFPIDQLCTADNRERTSSDASSATVDYDFDTETCTALTSNSVDIDI
jgi:hypothetical protein